MKVILKEEYSPFFGGCPKCGLKMELREYYYSNVNTNPLITCPYCGTELEIDEKEYEKICEKFTEDYGELPFE